jgi:hypothetical protein
MVTNNPRLRLLASRVTCTVYNPSDRVAIWRGQFCGETGVVTESVGKKVHIRLFEPSKKVQRLTTDGVVVVFKTSCILIA